MISAEIANGPVHSRRLKVAALLPILLVTAFSASPALASPVFLGTATIYDKLDAETCFASCDSHSFESLSTGNASLTSPDSTTKSTAVLSLAPSISARSEADIVSGGGLGTSTYHTGADAQVTLHYYFAAEGPQDIMVPVHITANVNVSITGTVADTGYSNFSEAHLIIPVANQDLLVQHAGTGTRTGSYSVDDTFYLDSNTAYEVLMTIKTVSNVITSDVSDIITMASIDPSFEIDDPRYSNYSIAFSGGLAAPATPLPRRCRCSPAAYLVRRRQRKIAAA